jgi:hypothetical protein
MKGPTLTSPAGILAVLLCTCRVLCAQQAAPPGPAVAAAPAAPAWSLHAQVTWIDQANPSFPAAYSGANSFLAQAESARTFSSSLFLGWLVLPQTELYYNPEMLQGHGLSGTVGIAGFPNGEGGKAAFPNLHYSTSRLFVRQTFELGGEPAKAQDGQNQVGRSYDADRVTLSAGKFSAADFFDANSYTHDPRTQFMNWALLESAAWDFPADALGYTDGLVAEWSTKNWELHYGIFMEPAVSNGTRLDSRVDDAHGQILQFDRSYRVGALTGTFRPFVFWNEARMGNYADALALGDIPNALFETRAYRSKVGFGLSWDQQLTDTLGAFARLSWDDGRTESFAYTEVDRSAAAGLSLSGSRWARKDDVLGLAAVVNAIVPVHQAYLAAGGEQGLILGDGALDYGPEEIVEAYYSVQIAKWLSVSPDFQYVWAPGYNRARGPVPIYALRAHLEF